MAVTALVRRVLGLPEARAAGAYTDAVLASVYAAATGQVHAAATAGVQAAASIVGRALASATIDGDGGAVDPQLLEGIGTDLVRSGRFLRRLTVGVDGRARILRAGAVSSVVYGDADPESWRYSLQMAGPSSARTVWAEAAEVVNVRVNADSLRPWEGIAPLSRAAASASCTRGCLNRCAMRRASRSCGSFRSRKGAPCFLTICGRC